MTELATPDEVTTSIGTLMARAQLIERVGAEVAPQLQSIAITGSMLEAFDPTRSEYVTEFSRLTEERAREFGRLVVAHSDDLRTELGDNEDKTLDEVWELAGLKLPDELLEFRASGLVDLAAGTLSEYGESLSYWSFENPDWGKWVTAALYVTKLAPVAMAGVTLVLVATGGAAAIGIAPLILAQSASAIAAYAADLAGK
ncbi:MAG: hypothetical protein IIB22_07125 [Chloroflexi bacterium]|nr:hypothetical protein [Chloroflexota bacterium]